MDELIKEQERIRARFKLDVHIYNVYDGEYGTSSRKKVVAINAVSRQAAALMLNDAGMNANIHDIRSAGLTGKPVSFSLTREASNEQGIVQTSRRSG